MQMRRERRLAVGEYQVRETISNQEGQSLCVKLHVSEDMQERNLEVMYRDV